MTDAVRTPPDGAPSGGGAAGAHEHAEPVYTRWRGPAARWPSADAFFAAPAHEDGAHVIEDADGRLDVYLRGDPVRTEANHALPVFFTGAVTRRDGGAGPYFSGLTIAAELGVPAIAVADRTMTAHRDLALAWYEGCADDAPGPGLAHFLRRLHEEAGKHLLLTGGSGGGFAALQMQRRLPGIATAFCWNPQTDLLRYSERLVREYLRSAFPGVVVGAAGVVASQGRLRSTLRRYGTLTDVWSGDLPASDRVLYLQNARDWHVATHALPYAHQGGLQQVDGAAWRDDDVVLMLGDWGDGHAVPPRAVLHEAVRSLMAEPVPWRVAEHLRRTFPDLLDPAVTPSAALAVDAGAAVRAPVIRRVSAGSLVVDAGTSPDLVAFHLYRGTERVRQVGYGGDPVARFDDLSPGTYRCRVHYRDRSSGTRTGVTTERVSI